MKWNYFTFTNRDGVKDQFRTATVNGQEVTQQKVFVRETNGSLVLKKASQGQYKLNDIQVHGGGYHCYLLEGWQTVKFADDFYDFLLN